MPNFPTSADRHFLERRKLAGQALGLDPHDPYFFEIKNGYWIHHKDEILFRKQGATPVSKAVDSFMSIRSDNYMAKKHLLEQRLKELDDRQSTIFNVKDLRVKILDGKKYYICPVGPPGRLCRINTCMMMDKSRADTEPERQMARSVFDTSAMVFDPVENIWKNPREFVLEEFRPAELSTSGQMARLAYCAAQHVEGGVVGTDASNAFMRYLLCKEFWYLSCLLIGNGRDTFLIVLFMLGPGHPESANSYDRLNRVLWHGMARMSEYPCAWLLPVPIDKIRIFLDRYPDELVILPKKDVSKKLFPVFEEFFEKIAADARLRSEIKLSIKPAEAMKIFESEQFCVVLEAISLYLDDANSFFLRKIQADLQLLGHTRTIPSCGVKIQHKKTKKPEIQKFAMLGSGYDFIKALKFATPEKTSKLHGRIEACWVSENRILSKLVQETNGLAVYIIFETMPQLKSCFRSGYELLRNVDLTKKFLTLPKFEDAACKKPRKMIKRFFHELLMVLIELYTQPFITFEKHAGLFPNNSVELFGMVDASGSLDKGYGGFSGNFFTFTRWDKQPKWLQKLYTRPGLVHPYHSTDAEDNGLLVVFITLAYENYRNGFFTSRQVIRFATDNLANAWNFNLLRPRSNDYSMTILRQFLQLIDCDTSVSWVPREFNTTADRLAAGDFETMPAHPTEAGVRLVGGAWRKFVRPNFKLLQALYRYEFRVEALTANANFAHMPPLAATIRKGIMIKKQFQKELKNKFSSAL